MICLVMGLPPTAPAQNNVDRPQPGTVEVPVQEDESDRPESGQPDGEDAGREAERRGKSGFLRLWNFANQSAGEGVAVFVARGSAVPPADQRLWLGRGSRPGELRGYAEFDPGNYNFFVLRDASRQGAMVTLPDEFDMRNDNLLRERLNVNLRAGAHHTILIHDENGRLAAKVLDDSAIEPTRLRLFNFTDEHRPDVNLLERDGRTPIAEDFSGESIISIPGTTRIVTIEVAYPTAVEGFMGRMNVECDFSNVRSCSLVVCHDRYGRLSVRAVEDAPR